jgi:intracellular multiplication protein IcmC
MSDGWAGNQIDVLSNLAQSLIPVQRMVTGAAYVIGLTFAIKALMTLKAHADNRSQMSSGGLKEPLLYFLVSAMLIYLPSGFEVLMNTTFGYSNVLAYAPVSTHSTLLDSLFGAGSGLGQTLTIIIQTIGVIAFVRGWVLIARSATQGQGQGGVGKGITHVFGGILAMNIVGTMEIINNTLFGGS